MVVQQAIRLLDCHARNLTSNVLTKVVGTVGREGGGEGDIRGV